MRNRLILRASLPVVLAAGFMVSRNPAAADTTHPAVKGDTRSGRIVFRNCEGCHAAQSNEQLVGPSLKGLFKKTKLVNGKKPSEPNIREILLRGYNSMPPFDRSLSEDKVQDLLAYLSTL